MDLSSHNMAISAHHFLIGHSGEVFAARFDSTGQYVASGSMDRSISTPVQHARKSK